MMRRGIGRRGRPSVIGTVARTAVVAGTATAVVGGMQHKQAAGQQAAQEQAAQDQAAEQQAAQEQAPPPPPPPAAPAGDDRISRLKELGELKNAGILTDEEFAAEKAKILGAG